jgi:hypothetical protein
MSLVTLALQFTRLLQSHLLLLLLLLPQRFLDLLLAHAVETVATS